MTCWSGLNPAGTSGPTACVGAGAGAGDTEVTADKDVVEGATGETVVKPPQAAVKSSDSPIATTLGSFMAETPAIPDAPPRLRPGSVFRPEFSHWPIPGRARLGRCELADPLIPSNYRSMARLPTSLSALEV